MKSQYTVATSPNEDQFVTYNEETNKVTVYNFNHTDYSITKVVEIDTPSGMTYQAYAEYSSDGSVLVVIDGQSFHRAYTN